MSNGKDMIIHLIAELIKKNLVQMSQYFPKSYEPFGGNINVNVDLSNYTTLKDLKGISHINISNLALKSNLANLRTKVDKINTEKLKTVPVNLPK